MMTEQAIAITFALGMAGLFAIGALKETRGKQEGVVERKAVAAVAVILCCQWLYFAFYLVEHPKDVALLSGLAVPLLFIVPALVALGVWFTVRFFSRHL